MAREDNLDLFSLERRENIRCGTCWDGAGVKAEKCGSSRIEHYAQLLQRRHGVVIKLEEINGNGK